MRGSYLTKKKQEKANKQTKILKNCETQTIKQESSGSSRSISPQPNQFPDNTSKILFEIKKNMKNMAKNHFFQIEILLQQFFGSIIFQQSLFNEIANANMKFCMIFLSTKFIISKIEKLMIKIKKFKLNSNDYTLGVSSKSNIQKRQENKNIIKSSLNFKFLICLIKLIFF